MASFDHYPQQLNVLVENRAELLCSSDGRTRLRAIRDLVEGVEQIERCIASEAHEAGMSWAEIGDVYGVTRQSAHKRFAALPVASEEVWEWLHAEDEEAPTGALVEAADRAREMVKTASRVHD